MQNQIKILATATVAGTVIKLAAVGSGHHVISYKATSDSKTHHEGVMFDDYLRANEWFGRVVGEAKVLHVVHR